jgi:YhcH/YjgK/YiaL family protein
MLPKIFNTAFEHAQTLSIATPIGKIDIDGENLFAIVSEYETLEMEVAKAETHNKYIDIQILISGNEYICWYPANSLPVNEPYDSIKDATFYDKSSKKYEGQVTLSPGTFAICFPWDIHSPQIRSGINSERVKKVVYKVSTAEAGFTPA